MLTDVAGIAVGHWTDAEAKTGCTVIVAPPGNTASGEVRGGAPASREMALLDPTRTVPGVDAVVLSGGSAFGLAAADGVMRALEAQGRGFPTRHGPIPIVVAMSLFDLAVGDASVRPGPDEGRLAVDAATTGPHAVGLVGAGTGATVGKWSGDPRPGGLGAATLRAGPLVVSALLAVNAYGAIDDGTTVTDPGPPGRGAYADGGSGGPATNTTVGVIATNARLDKAECLLVAQSGHDGLARALYPAHSAADGDAIVSLATGELDPGPAASDHVEGHDAAFDLARLRVLAQAAVTTAVRSVGSPTGP